MKKRGYEDLVVAALMSAAKKEGAKKTYMLFAAAMLNQQGYSMINDLYQAGLLRYEESKRTYFITEKGRRFLATYKKMMDLLFSTNGRLRSDI